MPPRANPNHTAFQAVYTDVDGTVTRYTTIFDFLLHDARERGIEPHAREFLASLRRRALSGEPRHAAYFTWWAGRTARDVEDAGEAWADELDRKDARSLFNSSVTAQLLRAPVRIVAVTASFPPALAHVKRHIPGLDILCPQLEVDRDGKYTGLIDEPMVGEAKARRVAEHSERHGIDLEQSVGYGDHPSDVPFLRLLGMAYLVDANGTPRPL